MNLRKTMRDATAWQLGRFALLGAVLVAVLGSALAFALSGDWAVLDPQGPVSAAENQILFNALAIMLAIIVPTIVATGVFAWWFRETNPRARYRPDFAYSGRLELVTWSIPILAILFLGGVAWTGSHDLDPARPLPGNGKPLEVQVVSMDWKWLFIYPDQHVASVNELVIPSGAPVHFTLTSSSVMNSFFVPQLGSMIYTMNGMATQLYLQADRPGTYNGFATHLSGDGFADMTFKTRAVDAAGFDQWLRTAQGSDRTLDDGGYRDLAQQSSRLAPATYKLADAGLFTSILTQKLPPGPGPELGRLDPSVEPKGNTPNVR